MHLKNIEQPAKEGASKVSQSIPGQRNKLKRMIPFIRLALSAAVLCLVIYWIAPGNLLDAFRHVSPGYLATAGVLLLAAQILSAYKWMLVVRSEGFDFGIKSAVRIYFIGMFFNNFLPTGLGGDVTRALLAARRARMSIVRSGWTVIFDRATGFIALAALSWVMAGFHYFGITGLAVSTLALMGGLLVNLSMRRRMDRLTVLPVLGKKVGLLLHPFRNPSLSPILLLSLLFNLMLATTVFLVSLGFGVHIQWPYIVVTIFVVSVSVLFPLFIGGFGAREAAFVFMLGFVGVEGGVAGAIGLT